MSEKTTVRQPESQWTLAPEGLHRAVCVDVWDKWEEKTTWKGKDRMTNLTRIVWVLDFEDDETGKLVEASQRYTASLHEKALLRQHLESWRGRRFTEEEARGFDLEKLIGKSCQVQIVHNLGSNGKTYANVRAVVTLGKGMDPLDPPEGYVRRKDRQKENAEVSTDDDNCPF